MLKRRGKWKKGSSSMKDGGKKPFNKKDVIYHKCTQLGNFQNECLLLKKESKKKKKALLSTWEDLKDDSTSEEEEEEKAAHLCFMAKSDNEVDFSDLTHEKLLDILDEMFLNSQTILSNYNELKKENKKLAKENFALKFEIDVLKKNV